MSLERLGTGDATCAYNNHFFGPTAYTSAFSMRPNLDPAGRTVATVTYRMTVTETIANTTTTDPAILRAITRLERNGGRLIYEGRGFGAVNINLAGGQKDVKFGPITRELSCKAVGGEGKAVELVWTVEWTTICPDAMGEAGTILWFNFTVAYEIDKEGYSTRTTESSLQIAHTRKKPDDKTLVAVADQHREKMVPKVPPGFRRQNQSYRNDAAKTTITAVVVDVQMPPNVPPDGVVDGSIENTWQTLDSIASWTWTIAATYDLARVEGVPGRVVEAYLALVLQRAAIAREMVIGAGFPGGGGLPARLGVLRGKKVTLIPVRALASEPNVIGRTQVRLSTTCMVAGVGFSEILRSGGLWRPIGIGGPGAGVEKEWKAWFASIPTTHSPRGHANLVLLPSDDALVDACVGTPIPVLPTKLPSQPTVPVPITTNGLQKAITDAFPLPAPEQSWVGYQSFVTVHTPTGRVLGSTLPVTPLPTTRGTSAGWNAMEGLPGGTPSNQSPFPPLSNLLGPSGQSLGASSAGGQTFFHQRTRPVLYVTLTGVAARIGYPIPVPEIIEINGVKPVLVGTPSWVSGVVGQTLVGPVVQAQWSMTYAFVEAQGIPTGAIPIPNNPTL